MRRLAARLRLGSGLRSGLRFDFGFGFALALACACALGGAASAAAQERPRVIVSTDIGGSDPDDFQSMVHFLLYADRFDVEGLISSPWGAGRKRDILTVIDKYEADYPNLRSHSDKYPAPDALRAVTKEGALDPAVGEGVTHATEGSDWIIRCAKRDDPRPLWVLVWGTIDDVAQALHDDPSIAPKLRVYYISSSNKKWGLAAYNYIDQHHPDLWMIENNSTFRGWFVGGNQDGDLGNRSFVSTHVKGKGALGDYFATMLSGEIKMGDTPSVVYLLDGDRVAEDPTHGGWGGRFVRAWDRPTAAFARLTTEADRVAQFSILELTLPVSADEDAARVTASMVVDGQEFPGFASGAHAFTFRFMAKDVKTWTYAIKSSSRALDEQRGAFTSVAPAPPIADGRPVLSRRHPRWWTDDPDPRWIEGPHQGAKTINAWREAFLRDFARRLDFAAAPAVTPSARSPEIR